MAPRIWSRQFLLIPIAFTAIWFFVNFVAFFAPSDLLSQPAKRMHLVDDLRINASSVPKSSRSHDRDVGVGIVDQIRPSSSNAVKADTFSGAIKNLTISDIRRIVTRANAEEKVLNAEKFKPNDGDVIAIVVQVHNRKIYLEYLIESLRKSKGISDALLIFSHDFFDQQINDLIRAIDFCRVVQIFYPLSLQLVPSSFPGDDPRDCPSDMPKEQALAISCQNAETPDSYGHYRNAKIVQLKHHWWWKANIVFHLKALSHYRAPVVFLEEDLFVVEDFVSAIKLMHQTAKEKCPSCKILSLAANQDATFTYQPNFGRGSWASVKSQFSNMGLSFTAETWREMQKCAETFCKFDDYNWDVTLQHVFTTCMENTAAMTLSSPRVFHLGSCGTHHTSENCDSTQKIKEIDEVVRIYKNFLHPKRLELRFDLDNRRSDVFYGGWGDKRDQELCLRHVIRI